MKLTKLSAQKLRGGYYTPPPIAKFLLDWAYNGKNNLKTLEPSMGDGVFIELIADNLYRKSLKKKEIGQNIWGIELFKEELEKAKDKLTINGFNPDKFNLFHGDFFTIFNNKLKNEKFDVIIGNPPFIRYQDFPEDQRTLALDILQKFGFHPNKLTNAWLFFLLVSVKMLNDHGKLAMVIPAELLQVKYAAEARAFLGSYFNSITLLSFKKLVFEGIQQEVVLLLADKSTSKSKGIDLIELTEINDLIGLKDKIKSPDHFKPIDHSNDKWLQYFLTKEEILFIRDLTQNPKLTKLGKLLDVDVGVVTGRNEYFVLNKETVEKYQLKDFVLPIVGRTDQINGGIIFKQEDWELSVNKGNRNYLLNIQNPINSETPKGLKVYIENGESLGVQDGYKCRIRRLWYSVPSIWIPDAFLYRQIHQYPKLVLNKAQAIPTDTIHRVKIYDRSKSKLITASFLNSLTFAFSEIYGRSYGGGVLELEPNEAEEIFIPYFPDVKLDLEKIDRLSRNKDIETILDYTDSLLLKENLGLTEKKISILRNIWLKLSDRRINRK